MTGPVWASEETVHMLRQHIKKRWVPVLSLSSRVINAVCSGRRRYRGSLGKAGGCRMTASDVVIV